MRPYIAIIQDSFREATASRTLQVLLVLILVLLAVLAIPGLRVERPWELTESQVYDGDGLAALLGRTREGAVEPAQQAIRDRLSPSLQQQCVDYRLDASPDKRDAVVKRLVREMNPVLEGDCLYVADLWRDVPLTVEGRKLLAEPWSELSPEERRRFNRLLFDGAFRGQIREVDRTRAHLTYVLDEMELGVPSELAQSLVQSAAYWILKWFVGAAGMLAAIIFTAGMIPQMFEPGAIDLLLSKPISRSAAFLAKFAGAGVFIVLNASLFVGGLWLILGLRHGEWSPRVLWAIPLFLLTFTIYFSVSAYVGMRWRNPILSIALTLVTWVVIFGLHQVWYWGQRMSLDGERAEVVLDSAAGPIVARKNGELLQWEAGVWQPIFADDVANPEMAIARRTGLMYPLLGPVLADDHQIQRLVAIERSARSPLFTSLGKIVVGTAEDGWKRRALIAAPHDTLKMTGGGSAGVFLMTQSGPRRMEFPTDAAAADEQVQLVPLDVAGVGWQDPVDVSMEAVSGDLAVYSRGQISLLRRNGSNSYDLQAELETDRPVPSLVALLADSVVLARSDGQIERFQRSTLDRISGEIRLPSAPRVMLVASDRQQVWILDHERRLHRLNESGQLSEANVRGQGQITAIALSHAGGLLVADRFPRVTKYDETGGRVETWEHHTGFAWSFLWMINPLRFALPKPDELDLLVREAVGARDSEERPGGDDLTREREYIDLWTPIWTSGLFVVCVLSLTCWTIERRDY